METRSCEIASSQPQLHMFQGWFMTSDRFLTVVHSLALDQASSITFSKDG